MFEICRARFCMRAVNMSLSQNLSRRCASPTCGCHRRTGSHLHSPAWGMMRAGLDSIGGADKGGGPVYIRSEEHTSELQSLMRSSYAVFCLKNNIQSTHKPNHTLFYLRV